MPGLRRGRGARAVGRGLAGELRRGAIRGFSYEYESSRCFSHSISLFPPLMASSGLVGRWCEQESRQLLFARDHIVPLSTSFDVGPLIANITLGTPLRQVRHCSFSMDSPDDPAVVGRVKRASSSGWSAAGFSEKTKDLIDDLPHCFPFQMQQRFEPGTALVFLHFELAREGVRVEIGGENGRTKDSSPLRQGTGKVF